MASSAGEEICRNLTGFDAVEVIASEDLVYVRFADGVVGRYDITVLTKVCRIVDYEDLLELFIVGERLFQHRKGGIILEWEGVESPEEWVEIETNPDIVQVEVCETSIYCRASGGWIGQYMGKPGEWLELDFDDECDHIAATSHHLYKSTKNGDIWQYDTRVAGDWNEIDAFKDTVQIATTRQNLYQLRESGQIYTYTGTGRDWTLIYNPENDEEEARLQTSSDRLFKIGSEVWYNSDNTINGWQRMFTSCKWTSFACTSTCLYLLAGGSVMRYIGV